MFKITGNITHVSEPRVVNTQKGTFYSQEVWLEWQDGKYEKIGGFEYFDKQPFDESYVGTQVDVTFTVDGRKYEKNGEEKLFTKLKIKNVQEVGAADVPAITRVREHLASIAGESKSTHADRGKPPVRRAAVPAEVEDDEVPF